MARGKSELRGLGGPEKAAILLLALGDEYAAKLFRMMEDDEIREISQVMASKQRPRRLAVMGSDGREYVFLLKGHEDLRQDERVMQLFGLVNTLLTVDASCARLDLGIQRYSVVPLSANPG